MLTKVFKSLELTNVTIDKNWKSFIAVKSDGNDEFEFADFEPSIPARLKLNTKFELAFEISFDHKFDHVWRIQS